MHAAFKKTLNESPLLPNTPNDAGNALAGHEDGTIAASQRTHVTGRDRFSVRFVECALRSVPARTWAIVNTSLRLASFSTCSSVSTSTE